MEEINSENAIMGWGHICCGSEPGDVPLVAAGNMFLKQISTSSEMRIISRMLEVDIMAVAKYPYGKRSKYFMDNDSHNLLVATGINKITSPSRCCTLQRMSDGRLVMEMPAYIGGDCLAYIIMGPFFTSSADASQSSSVAPVISFSKIEAACQEICQLGSKYLSWCCQCLRQECASEPPAGGMIFNCGNFFDYRFDTDTFALSKRAASIIGWSTEKPFHYDDLLSIVPEKARDKVATALRNLLLLGKEEYTIEAPILRACDGKLAYIEISGTLIRNSSGEYARALGSIADISVLKQTQADLREEVESKNRLIRIIGHDLRTPFNGIIGFSELLNINIEQGKYDMACEFADIIKRSAVEGFDLLVNLLDYSNSQSGSLRLEMAEFDLYKPANSICRLSAAQALRKGITLHNSIPSGTWLYSDEYKISTVIRNLTSNAIKFCEKDGVVIIGCERAGENIRIEVSNTGQPIPDDKLKKINRGLEVESTFGTAHEKGFSIGLSLCHSFLKALGSRLQASCNEGITTFMFQIKANSQEGC